jgi:hypothetical protein
MHKNFGNYFYSPAHKIPSGEQKLVSLYPNRYIMEAILKYNLDDPDDQRAHLRAIKSLDMALALNDIAYLWHAAEREMENNEYRENPYGWWTNHIHDILEERGINTEELII